MIKLFATFIITTLLLTACSTTPNISQTSEETPIDKSSDSFVSSPDSQLEDRLHDGEKYLSEYELDPPYDFDPSQVDVSYFGDFFVNEYENTNISTYTIGANTPWENEVTLLEGEEDGPVVYIIASVHANETAPWIAANVVKNISIKSGSVHILSPANIWGLEKTPPSRYVTEEQDLNRSFPGDVNGTEAEQVAATIYEDVKRVNPDFILDLHEAWIVENERDFLGSSLIFTDLHEQDSMFWDMILETQLGDLCSRPFNYFTPGPENSVNRTFSNELEIPVITVETFRGYEMENRVFDQISIIERVLIEFGII